MSTAATQAAAFYREVATTRTVWTIKDAGGFPAPKTAEGRAQAFWSSQSRAERVIESVSAYGGLKPVEVPWKEFCEYWVPAVGQGDCRSLIVWSQRQDIWPMAFLSVFVTAPRTAITTS